MITSKVVEGWAMLIDKYGFMLIFAIVSALFNLYIVTQLLRGKIITFSMYNKAVDEADRLQKAMEVEYGKYMSTILEFMGGLKPNNGGNRNDNNDNSG